MPLDEILRAPRNPKRHDAETIAASVGRFGIVEIPALDERTGRLVAGHGRLDDWEARRAAGQDPPDGVMVDADGQWLVPVSRGWASRTDHDAEAYLIVSNSSTERGGWDNPGLAQALADLRDQDDTLMEIVGFGDDFIARHLDADPDPWAHARPAGDDDEPDDDLVEIILTVPPLLEQAWQAHRDAYGDDTAALTALLALHPQPAG